MPAAARSVFGGQWRCAASYAAMLAGEGLTRGLIGPAEVDRIWERHLFNCAVLTEALPKDAEVADIGSGAGLPGLVVAIRRPDLKVTLVEPLLRRSRFLHECVERLALDNVDVVRARAQQLHGRVHFGVVTSRAVAPLPRLLAWSLPLVRPGGSLVAIKGATAHEELAAATATLSRWRVGAVQVLALGRGEIDPPTTAIRVETTAATRLG